MSCDICRDGNVEIFIMHDDSKVIGYNSWCKLGLPQYKDSYLERCGKCFPEFVERHNSLLKKLQMATNNKDQLGINIMTQKIKENWNSI